MDVIARTGFLPPAYALLEVLITMIIAWCWSRSFKSMAAEALLVPFVALINIYMLRLIRDIDNPFDYEPTAASRARARSLLFPIDEYRARLAERVEAPPVRPSTSGS